MATANGLTWLSKAKMFILFVSEPSYLFTKLNFFLRQLDSKSGENHLLDSSSVVRPTLSNTWFPVLIKSIYGKVTKSTKKDTDSSSKLSEADTEDESSLTESDAPPNGTSKEKGMGVRTPAVKTGGKRRKTTKRR